MKKEIIKSLIMFIILLMVIFVIKDISQAAYNLGDATTATLGITQEGSRDGEMYVLDGNTKSYGNVFCISQGTQWKARRRARNKNYASNCTFQNRWRCCKC